MNVLLWILSGVLVLLCVAGGLFKVAKPDDVAKQVPAVPIAGWRVFGVVEVVAGILLIVPWATGWMPMLTPAAAAVLVVESLVLSGLYARVSTKVTGANPLVYSVVMAILAAVVAIGRYAPAA
jgi:hypothetical protein